MGYYSDVRAIIYGEDKDQLQALITKAKLSSPDMLDHFFVERYRLLGGEHLAYLPNCLHVLEIVHDSIKFYDEFEFVQAFRQMLTEAVEVFGLTFEFIRVGEDPGDVETVSGGEQVQGLLNMKIEIVRYLAAFKKLPETDDE